MKPMRPHIGKMLRISGVLIALGLFGYVIILPAYVHRTINRQLAEAGFTQARFTLDHVSLSHIALRDVRLDEDDRLTVDHVRLHYHWRELLRGSLRDVEMLGVRYVLNIDTRAGHIDLGPLLQWQGGAGDGELPFERLRLRGMQLVMQIDDHRLHLPLDATMTRRGESGLTLHGRTSQWLYALDIEGALDWSRGQQLALTLRSEGIEATLVYDSETTEQRWQVALEQLDMPQPAGLIMDQRVMARQLRMHGRAALDEQGRLTSLDLHADAADLQLNDHKLVLPRLHAGVVDDTFTATLDAQGEPWQLQGLTLSLPADVRQWLISDTPVHVTLDQLQLTDAQVKLDQLSLATTMAMLLPMRAATDDEGDGDEAGAQMPSTAQADLAVQQVHWRDHSFPAIHADLSRTGHDVTLQGAWPLDETTTIHLNGRLDLSGSQPAARFTAALPATDLQPGMMLTDLISALAPVRVTGNVGMTFQLAYDNARLNTQAAANFDQARISTPDDRYQFHNVTGSFAIDPLNQWRSPGGQRLRWGSAQLGEFRFNEGVIRVTVESLDSILVEYLSWQMKSGRFWAQGFRFDPQQPDISVNLFLEGVDLGDWLALMSLNHADGQGRLYGRIPLRIATTPHWRFRLGDGFLHAEDGGRLRIRDTAVIEKMLAQGTPAAQTANTGGAGAAGGQDYGQMVQQRIVQSLQDFEFDELRFRPSVVNGQPRLQAAIAGRGARPPHQALNLTLNFTGHEDLIDFAIRMKLGMDRAEDRELKELMRR